MDGEAGWWTTSGNIGLPPLARVMGMGRQHMAGTRGSCIVSNTADVPWMSVVRVTKGVGGVCEMNMCLGRGV